MRVVVERDFPGVTSEMSCLDVGFRNYCKLLPHASGIFTIWFRFASRTPMIMFEQFRTHLGNGRRPEFTYL